MGERIAVPAFKVYVWACPACKKENGAVEPFDKDQKCSQCGTQVEVGPLRGIMRLQNPTDVEELAEAAMNRLSVRTGRREHVKAVVMEAFKLALKEKT